jgi:hypothetical protein
VAQEQRQDAAVIDTESEPGSWAAILPFCRNITVIPAPRLSRADNPGGSEAHPASVVAAARGEPVEVICAVKDGNGAFHHSSEVDHGSR